MTADERAMFAELRRGNRWWNQKQSTGHGSGIWVGVVSHCERINLQVHKARVHGRTGLRHRSRDAVGFVRGYLPKTFVVVCEGEHDYPWLVNRVSLEDVERVHGFGFRSRRPRGKARTSLPRRQAGLRGFIPLRSYRNEFWVLVCCLKMLLLDISRTLPRDNLQFSIRMLIWRMPEEWRGSAGCCFPEPIDRMPEAGRAVFPASGLVPSQGRRGLS